MQPVTPPLLLVAALLLCPLAAFGQADEREEIVTLTEQIRKEPTKVDLFLRRGDLYRTIQNWDAAQADYDFARALDPKIDDIDFRKGRLFLEANWPLSAKLALDRFLSNHAGHVDALIARARAHSKLNLRAASAQDYSRALQLSTQPQPRCLVAALGASKQPPGNHSPTSVVGRPAIGIGLSLHPKEVELLLQPPTL